jgi:hypothetical protein
LVAAFLLTVEELFADVLFLALLAAAGVGSSSLAILFFR